MTYLTRMVAFLITVFLGLFSVVGTPTWKRQKLWTILILMI